MARRFDTATRHVWTAEERTRLLVDSVKDYAIFMLDPDGVIISWSPGAEQVKGYRAEEVIGKHFSMFYPHDDAVERSVRMLRQAADRGRVEDEGWRLRKDGERFWASVVVSAVRGPDGELVGYAKVTRDLTERRKAEAERVRLARAEEAVKLRDAFLSIASHELKTPLAALQLVLQTLGPLVEGQDRAANKVERALRSCRRLALLVDELLDVSRLASGRFRMQPSEFDLADAARELADHFSDQLEAEGIRLESRIAPRLVGTWDRLRVEQILTNLLGNAIRHGGGADIELTVARDGDEAVVTVSDRGTGFPVEALGRVFDRFERAASVRHHGGLGLGLYVVREIAVAHGGTTAARNLPDGGALVEVRLPIAPRQEVP